MLIPAGLSSEASFGEDKFCVQTEFAQHPKPRVTTTISINGAVIEKVDNVWDKLPQTEEDREEIERFLRKQHQQVLATIKEKEEKLVSPVSEKSGFESWGEEAIPGEDEIILKVREELLKTEGVLGWAFISKGELIMTHPISEPEDQKAEDLLWLIEETTCFLSTPAELGKFVGGFLDSPVSSMIFLPLHSYLLAVKLDPKVHYKKLVKKIKSIAYTKNAENFR